jgi:hypothetical protein
VSSSIHTTPDVSAVRITSALLSRRRYIIMSCVFVGPSAIGFAATLMRAFSEARDVHAHSQTRAE